MRAWRPRSWPWWTMSPSGAGRNHPPAAATALLLRRGQQHDGASSSLKAELRRLYKLIHPDLLHNRPVQQAANQKSFQLLQEYLSAAKGGGGPNRFAYHFEFYICGKASEDDLEKVEISLPAPRTWGGSRQDHDVSPTTKKSIAKLFAACGLAVNLSAVVETMSLPVLFQEASELQRQSEARQLDLRRQVSLISNAFRMGRGIRVLFEPPVREAHLAVQVELLERMARTLDESTAVDLAGTTLVFGDRYKVDYLGRLWLKSEDDAQLWTRFLHQVDLGTAAARRTAARSRQKDEVTVARLLGVEYVFAADVLALHPDYSSFLCRMESGAAQRGPVGRGRFSELPVQVAEVEVATVDENLGYIVVPARAEISALYSHIEQAGDKALIHRRLFRQRETKLEDLRKHLRVKLRLRHLTLDRELTTDQLTSACTRLSNHVSVLRVYMEGLAVHISDENRLPSEESGYFVHMKWNFSLDDL